MRVEEALKEANLRLKPLCENPSRVAKILLMSYLDVSVAKLMRVATLPL